MPDANPIWRGEDSPRLRSFSVAAYYNRDALRGPHRDIRHIAIDVSTVGAHVVLARRESTFSAARKRGGFKGPDEGAEL
jgi:hypothetical protein